MAEIRPFLGLRYSQRVVGDISSVVTPPYDVIDAQAQEAYYQRSSHNIIRVELGKQSADDSPHDNRYTRAAGHLEEWLRSGVLRADQAPSVYVYQHTFTHRGKVLTRTGFLAAMRLEEWKQGIVLPHEATMAGPKADRLSLMRATGVNCSPIFTLYEDHDGTARETLARIVATEPAMDFQADSSQHRIWAVSDQSVIRRLSNVVRGGPVYIADGHHRYETALFYRDQQRIAHPGYHGDEAWNFVMTLMVEVDDAGLAVLPTHRLVNPRSENSATLAEQFLTTPVPIAGGNSSVLPEILADLERRGQTSHIFAVYGMTPDGFALFEPRSSDVVTREMPASRDLAWRELDVSILTEVLLRRCYGLTDDDFEDESRVAYTRDEVVAQREVDSGHYKLAIFLNPTAVRQVLAVARAGEVMPHKSTYFHPKPVTGVVLSRLADRLIAVEES